MNGTRIRVSEMWDKRPNDTPFTPQVVQEIFDQKEDLNGQQTLLDMNACV